MRRSLLFGLLICVLPAAAADRTLELDPARTSVTFTLGDVLHRVHGAFKLKQGCLKFDPETGKASGAIVVDVTSGDSGSGARDKRMHKEILESARFPEAVFTPDGVTGTFAPSGESQMDVHGMFQIHGASREMKLHFLVNATDRDVSASTTFVIPYVQWGMKNPSTFVLRVSDKVEFTVRTAGRIQ